MGWTGRIGGMEKTISSFLPILPVLPIPPSCQFVNLRMRTLSTRPKPASVAIIDDPP
jgi:hypothetical protein